VADFPRRAKQRIVDPDAVVWQSDGSWLGSLREHPDYWTQGEDLEDLREHLRDLNAHITSGRVPGVRAQRDG
jgi:hypothetical protein